jgi:hypothetical protein
MFEILRADESVGIVWRHRGAWLADRSSMSAPAVRGSTREEAVTNLLNG